MDSLNVINDINLLNSKKNTTDLYTHNDNDNINETFNGIATTLNYGVISYLESLNNFYNKVESNKLFNTSSIQKGGTLIDHDLSPEQAFMLFLNASKVELIGVPSYSGIVVKLTFDTTRAGRNSPYHPFNTAALRQLGGVDDISDEDIAHQKNTLVLKVVNIKNDEYTGHIAPFGKKLENGADFLEEFRVQQEIAIATSDFFEAATPYVVFGGIYHKTSPMGINLSLIHI